MRISDWSSDVCSSDLVTARRRDERLQDVPVSVSAFSAEALARSTIQTVADINTITPGFRAGAEGGKENASISLRGIGQVPLGEASPGVVTYFADIPLPSFGSNIPTFVLSSIQVLIGHIGRSSCRERGGQYGEISV